MKLPATPELAGIAVVAILGFWILGAHNRLVRLRQAVKSAFAQVDEPLRQRHDQLAELIAAAAPLQAGAREALAALDAARLEARTAADQVAQRTLRADRLARLAAAEQTLQAEVARVAALVEGDPALYADERVRTTVNALSATQHRLAAAREGFNAEVRTHNRQLRQFPTRFVAAMFGFEEAGEV